MRTVPIILAALIALFVALSPLAVAAQAVDLRLASGGEARIIPNDEIPTDLRLASGGEAPGGGVMLRLAADGSEPPSGEPLNLVIVTPPKENENAPPENAQENLLPENLPPENLPPENAQPESAPENVPFENMLPENREPIRVRLALASDIDWSESLQFIRLVAAEEAGLENMRSVRLVLAESGEP